MLTSPILSQRKLRQMLALPQFAGSAQTFVDLYYDEDEGLEAAIAPHLRDDGRARRARRPRS